MSVVIHEFESNALRGNRLGDPHIRKIPVYLPPSYHTEPEKRYPVVFMLHGFTGNSTMWLNVNSFYTPTVPERFEKLIQTGRCGEMILVFVDGYNGMGGSQYVNSDATGNYEDFVQELVTWSDSQFRTNGQRGVAGKSSGGFGAVRLALNHPDIFHAFASHAGDMYFEYCYKPDFPKVVNGLAPFLHNPNPCGAFLTKFAETESKGKMVEVINILAMAACYSPMPDGDTSTPCGFELPFDMHTGELNEKVWQRWLAFDPVQMLDKAEHLEALKGMRGAYLDAGIKDEYFLHLGARIFVQKARKLGVTNLHHEEFDAGHRDINYRYDNSLPFLYQALS
jgi:poly(3-hydroxybutyrate) depolymerase